MRHATDRRSQIVVRFAVSQIVVRFDVARLIARPIADSHSSRLKKHQLKIKKILIARLVGGHRSQVVRHVTNIVLVACRRFSRRSQIAGRATCKRT
ncbi:hypothetical protein YC2023_075191 [Brassica napus]